MLPRANKSSGFFEVEKVERIISARRLFSFFLLFYFYFSLKHRANHVFEGGGIPLFFLARRILNFFKKKNGKKKTNAVFGVGP
jgi:hypothetical protein